MGEGVLVISSSAFMNCTALHTVEFSPKLTSISDYTFYGCQSLTDARFYDGLNAIGVSAFDGCSSLGTVRLPRSVDKVFDNAFANCVSLSKLIYDGTLMDYAAISVGEGNEYLDYAATTNMS